MFTSIKECDIGCDIYLKFGIRKVNEIHRNVMKYIFSIDFQEFRIRNAISTFKQLNCSLIR